MVGPVVYHTIS